jgi:enoyl-CoA hydratase
MSYETILVDVEDRLAVVTFNRPEKRNAIDQTMITELHDALDGLVADGAVECAIFQGAGDKAFVGGADIAQLKERDASDALRTINAALFNKIEALPFPTIAAVKGYCLGGGMELAMCCDMRVSGEGAKFGQPEVALGIIPAAGGTQRLPRLVGLDEVMSGARELAGEILKNGGLAVRLAKLNLNNSARTGQDSGLLLEQITQAVLFESEDKHARMAAFLEKRKKK